MRLLTVAVLLPLLAASTRATAKSTAPASTSPPAATPAAKVVSERDLVSDDDSYRVRLSLPTMSDVQSWTRPGFRLSLGYSYGHFWGFGPAVSLKENAITIRMLERLDQYWSAGMDLEYALASGPAGLRFGGTLQLVFHPWRQLSVGLGVGYGGLILSRLPGTATIDPSAPVDVVYGSRARLAACTGGGWVGELRADYLFVVGPLFATGPFVEVDTQYTECSQQLNQTDTSTGLPVYARQWWLQQGASTGWWFTWR